MKEKICLGNTTKHSPHLGAFDEGTDLPETTHPILDGSMKEKICVGDTPNHSPHLGAFDEGEDLSGGRGDLPQFVQHGVERLPDLLLGERQRHHCGVLHVLYE